MPFRRSPLLLDALTPPPAAPRDPHAAVRAPLPAPAERVRWVHALARHEARAARRKSERWFAQRMCAAAVAAALRDRDAR